LFNRLAWNIFKLHPGRVERELFSDAGCHVSFPLGFARHEWVLSLHLPTENETALTLTLSQSEWTREFFDAKAKCSSLLSYPLALLRGGGGRGYARFAFATTAAWVPAKRPNTAPFIRPDPPG